MSSLIKKLKNTLGVSRRQQSQPPNLHATQIANTIREQNNVSQIGRVPRLNERGLEALRTVLLTEVETARKSSSNNRSSGSRSSSRKDIIKSNQDSSSSNISISSRPSSPEDEQIIIKYMNGLTINSFVAFTWLMGNVGNLAYLNNNMSLSHYFHIFNITVMIFYTFIQKIESAKKDRYRSLQNLDIAQLNDNDINTANSIMNGGGGEYEIGLSKMIKMIKMMKGSSIHYRNAIITLFVSIFIIVLMEHVKSNKKKTKKMK
jgi:hypothetical protein